MKLTIDERLHANLIGSVLKSTRIMQNLTQSELSIKLNSINVHVTRLGINRIENYTRIVKDFELLALSIVLEVSIDSLVDFSLF